MGRVRRKVEKPEGTCTSGTCLRPAQDGKRSCRKCREMSRANAIRRREKAREEGICVKCMKWETGGKYLTCKGCREHHRELDRAYFKRRSGVDRRRRARRLEDLRDELRVGAELVRRLLGRQGAEEVVRDHARAWMERHQHREEK